MSSNCGYITLLDETKIVGVAHAWLFSWCNNDEVSKIAYFIENTGPGIINSIGWKLSNALNGGDIKTNPRYINTVTIAPATADFFPNFSSGSNYNRTSVEPITPLWTSIQLSLKASLADTTARLIVIGKLP
jgi:hypothetical protein